MSPVRKQLIPIIAALALAACAGNPPVDTDAADLKDAAIAPTVHNALFRTEGPKKPDAVDSEADPLLKLGPGDAVAVQVFGRPEMNTTTYVTDQGTIDVPLVGAVKVEGLSPSKAAQRVAWALRDGQFLNDPHVNITLSSFKSQQVSVLGEVHTPGRFPVESRTTPLDLLAQAGGPTENASDVIYVLRPDGKGNVARFVVDLGALRAEGAMPQLALRGGDSLFVPKADQFYIYGEVHTPNMYRLEPGMTVLQAIARGGGITPRGSPSRIEVSRHSADGKLNTVSVKPTDEVQPNDVIRVKERIF
jgi:polysaccharide export outer membrane protein